MGFIDTHCHIYEPEFDADREDVVARAKEAGLDALLLPNINAGTIQPMLELCKKHSGYAYPMLGLHPEDVKADYKDVLQDMHSLLSTPSHPFIAIGEIGLDYYWDKTYYKEQQDAFEQQIGWAEEAQLPLVIHTRSAHEELVEIMKKHTHTNLSGIFHCFGGTLAEAEELLQFDNFVLGIGGALTFKKSKLPEVLREIPLERIVIETDSPYLTPVPNRGKRNEPAFAAYTLQKVADVYGKSAEEVMQQTNNNVRKVFKCLNA